MEKAKSNGRVGHAVPAAAVMPQPKETAPPGDPFDQVKALLSKMGAKKYAEGYRAATTIIARCIGQLDGDARAKLLKSLTQLEEDLHEAEQAAL
jgi:hypothetical protein